MTYEEGLLRDVARRYVEFAEHYQNPISNIALLFAVSERTVSRWVAEARSRGLLDRVRLANEKVGRVAQRLGVSYADLETAIREEADGDIRISRRSSES